MPWDILICVILDFKGFGFARKGRFRGEKRNEWVGEERGYFGFVQDWLHVEVSVREAVRVDHKYLERVIHYQYYHTKVEDFSGMKTRTRERKAHGVTIS
jgi:hypothetical protein